MSRSEKVVIGVLTSFIFLGIMFFTGLFFNRSLEAGCVGLAMGLIILIINLKKFINEFYKLKYWLLVVIYIILSVGTFGFFMGVPVFNIMIGIGAGVYIGRRFQLHHNDDNRFIVVIKKTSLYSTIIMFFVCVASASIALTDKYTAANLEGMFNITTFDITKQMIYGLIGFGGIGLLLLQYISTLYAGKWVFRMNKNNEPLK